MNKVAILYSTKGGMLGRVERCPNDCCWVYEASDGTGRRIDLYETMGDALEALIAYLETPRHG